MMLAITSMPLSGPDPGKAADPATTAAPIATPPWMPIAASVRQDSIRAIPARRTQSAGPATGPMPSRGVGGAQAPREQPVLRRCGRGVGVTLVLGGIPAGRALPLWC